MDWVGLEPTCMDVLVLDDSSPRFWSSRRWFTDLSWLMYLQVFRFNALFFQCSRRREFKLEIEKLIWTVLNRSARFWCCINGPCYVSCTWRYKNSAFLSHIITFRLMQLYLRLRLLALFSNNLVLTLKSDSGEKRAVKIIKEKKREKNKENRCF